MLDISSVSMYKTPHAIQKHSGRNSFQQKISPEKQGTIKEEGR